MLDDDAAVLTCRRVGRRYTETWPGKRVAPGYTVLAELTDGYTTRTWVAGFATPIIRMGRQRGWVVLDASTGDTVFGAGDSTALGEGLGDCLYLYARHLEETGAIPSDVPDQQDA